MADDAKTGLEDPRAVEILTTEHWSLLSSRTLGYQEIIGRTTIFVSIVSATVVALAVLAQPRYFGPAFFWYALLLLSVAFGIGIATFFRSVTINYEDALWVAGMNLLRKAYVQIVPELKPYFVTSYESDDEQQRLRYGARQRLANIANSLTTTSSVVAALNSVLAGALASDVSELAGGGAIIDVVAGVVISLVCGTLPVAYAARFRRRHAA
jgi:hypothetical protein